MAGEGRCDLGDACLLDLDCAEGACLHGTCQRLVDGSVCSDPNECASDSCDVITRSCKSGCLVDADCGTGVCSLFQCIPAQPNGEACFAASCQADCGACPLATPCTLDADCASGFCLGVCFAEGSSGPGRACLVDRECASGDCQAGFCKGSCGDGTCTVVPDGESCFSAGCQTDCGKCPNSTPCTLNADCASGLCFALACRSPFCGDGTCSASESCSSCALDCGLCCAGPGTLCLLDSACCSGNCDGFIVSTCQ